LADHKCFDTVKRMKKGPTRSKVLFLGYYLFIYEVLRGVAQKQKTLLSLG